MRVYADRRGKAIMGEKTPATWPTSRRCSTRFPEAVWCIACVTRAPSTCPSCGANGSARCVSRTSSWQRCRRCSIASCCCRWCGPGPRPWGVTGYCEAAIPRAIACCASRTWWPHRRRRWRGSATSWGWRPNRACCEQRVTSRGARVGQPGFDAGAVDRWRDGIDGKAKSAIERMLGRRLPQMGYPET